MNVTGAVNSMFFGPAESYQREDHPIILMDVKEPEVEEAVPYRPGYGRRFIVILMAMFLGVAIFGILGLTLVQGSWWYSYGTDLPLDAESRSRIEAILDEVEASGTAPQAAAWLDAALAANHPSDVRVHLITAQEALKATGDPEFIEAARELREIIGMIQSSNLDATTTPYSPTLKWP
jgi:hypothetical protein